MKKILVTGAGGSVAQFLRAELAGQYALRLSDVQEVSDLRSGEEFVPADLANIDDLLPAVEGVDGIVHLGAFSVESDWDTILAANIAGTYNLFEAARRKRVKRIVFASSNHAVGFYRRDQRIDHACYPRPDSRYGLSKVFGETLGSLYADKYGCEVLCIRIGNVTDRPMDVRRLSIWMSPRDFAQLVRIGLEHPDIHFEIVYGASENLRSWWDNSNAHRLGYKPMDESEDFAEAVFAEHAANSGDPVADAHQGGAFTTTEIGGDPLKPMS